MDPSFLHEANNRSIVPVSRFPTVSIVEIKLL